MKNKNLPLIVGIALPIVFIIIISVVIFLPSFFIKPQYNFIYALDNNYYAYNQSYKNTFGVENGKIVSVPISAPLNLPRREVVNYLGDYPKIYLYNVKNGTSHEIGFAEAEKLSLDAGPSSPDGYSISYEYGNYGFFDLIGGNNNSNGYFIYKGNAKKRLLGFVDDNSRYYGSNSNFKIIGWIK